MLQFIDKFLNSITMYRLVLYSLIFMLLAAIFLSFFGLIPYSPADIFSSAVVLIAISWVINKIFSYVFEVPANVESVYITALILALIITPPGGGNYFQFLAFVGWVAALAMASKYIVAVKKKHIFNPAALAVAITAFAINQSASWWIGTFYMAPFVLIAGILIVRKVRRGWMVSSFLLLALASILTTGTLNGTNAAELLKKIFFESPILFFAFIMLTEPLTTPPTKFLQICYGALIGLFFAPFIHLGPVYSTPELALIIGNIFSYIVSPKEKLILTLKNKNKLSQDIYNFEFEKDRKIKFKPGQYLEWTLGTKHPDSRGIRRYFTIASSPTEENVQIGVRFNQKSSSFKTALVSMKPGDKIFAGQRAGDFTLPKNKAKKLVFIAGGIGITPFRSMIKYLLDKNEKRDIILFYSVKHDGDIVYKDVFERARGMLGIKTIYAITGENSKMDSSIISDEAPDFIERIFYLSGPRAMVVAFEDLLRKMNVPRSQIKKDFFPGYA